MPDAPTSTTPHYGLGQWNDGENPGATALNENWTICDTEIFSASQQTVTYAQPIEKVGTEVVLNLGNNLKLTGDNLETIQNIRPTDSPGFEGINVWEPTIKKQFYMPKGSSIAYLSAFFIMISGSTVLVGTQETTGQDLSHVMNVLGKFRVGGQLTHTGSYFQTGGSIQTDGVIYTTNNLAADGTLSAGGFSALDGRAKIKGGTFGYGPANQYSLVVAGGTLLSGSTAVSGTLRTTGDTYLGAEFTDNHFIFGDTEVTGTFKVTANIEAALITTPVSMHALQQIGVGAYSGPGMFYVDGGDSSFKGDVVVTGSVSSSLDMIAGGTSAFGVVIHSPDGTPWRISISDAGAISASGIVA